MMTLFQKILPTCIPPRKTRFDKMSMAVEMAKRKAAHRLLIGGDRPRSWRRESQCSWPSIAPPDLKLTEAWQSVLQWRAGWRVRLGGSSVHSPPEPRPSSSGPSTAGSHVLRARDRRSQRPDQWTEPSTEGRGEILPKEHRHIWNGLQQNWITEQTVVQGKQSVYVGLLRSLDRIFTWLELSVFCRCILSYKSPKL